MHTAIKVVRYGAGTVLGVTMIACVGLFFFQNKLLYMPNPPGFPPKPEENPVGCRSPSEWNIQGNLANSGEKDTIPYENAMLVTSDGFKIHTWLLLHPNSTQVPTLIYFHGNAGNMGFRLQNAAKMFAAVGINVLMMDYRGYGNSEGTPDEVGLNIDADTVLKYAKDHPRLKGSPLVAFGRSLGGAVSIALAARNPQDIQAVIVENTFLSVSAMVDKLMPAVAFLKFLVLRIGWNSDASIKTLKQPIMFISGDRDELVPPEHMRQLYELTDKSDNIDFYSVRGGTHNDTWVKAGADYYRRMKAFMSKVTKFALSSAPICDASEKEPMVALPTMTTDFRVTKSKPKTG